MLTVSLSPNRTFKVFFDHIDPKRLSKKYAGKTECKILLLPTGQQAEAIYFIGKAVCYKPDRFNKSVGRRIAFTKALKLANLPKNERTIFWKDYFARCSDLQPKKKRAA